MNVIRPNSPAARDIAHALHPYTDLETHQQIGPTIIARGEGVRVWDDTGRDYIESVAGLWCANLGFSNERLARAAYNQMMKLPFYHAFTGKSHDPLIDLSEALLARAPVPMSKVIFSGSGSEANDTAIKIAWYYNNALGRPAKKKIIGRLKGYHGVTIGAASLTGLPYTHRSFDLPLPGFIHTMTPHHYHNAEPNETEEAFATRCADTLEQLIEAEGADTIAAFFAEPIMGAGGVIVPRGPISRRSRPCCSGTTSCWWRTRSSAASGARATTGERRPSACSPTSSPAPRRSRPRSCRSPAPW